MTVAYGGTGELVRAPVEAPSQRVAAFAMRPRPPYTAGVGREADDAMVAEWSREIRSALPDVDAEVAIVRHSPVPVVIVPREAR